MSACFLHRGDLYGFVQREPARRADKDVDAITLYGVDWAAYLTDGRTITGSQWIVETGDVQVGDGAQIVATSFGDRTPAAPNFDDTRTTAWLYSGTAGQDNLVTNRILTSDGSVEDASMLILATQRR